MGYVQRVQVHFIMNALNLKYPNYITINYLPGNFGPADPGLEPHLCTMGVAGVDPDCLHIAAVGARSGLDALLLQQVPP